MVGRWVWQFTVSIYRPTTSFLTLSLSAHKYPTQFLVITICFTYACITPIILPVGESSVKIPSPIPTRNLNSTFHLLQVPSIFSLHFWCTRSRVYTFTRLHMILAAVCFHNQLAKLCLLYWLVKWLLLDILSSEKEGFRYEILSWIFPAWVHLFPNLLIDSLHFVIDIVSISAPFLDRVLYTLYKQQIRQTQHQA